MKKLVWYFKGLLHNVRERFHKHEWVYCPFPKECDCGQYCKICGKVR